MRQFDSLSQFQRYIGFQVPFSFIIIIMIVIMIIAFKGAIPDFFTISSLRLELSPTRTLKSPGRNRVQITCNCRALITCSMSCCVPRGTEGQLSY